MDKEIIPKPSNFSGSFWRWAAQSFYCKYIYFYFWKKKTSIKVWCLFSRPLLYRENYPIHWSFRKDQGGSFPSRLALHHGVCSESLKRQNGWCHVETDQKSPSAWVWLSYIPILNPTFVMFVNVWSWLSKIHVSRYTMVESCFLPFLLLVNNPCLAKVYISQFNVGILVGFQGDTMIKHGFW